MKSKLMLLAAGFAALVFAGCATTAMQPAQIASVLCAPIKTAEANIAALAAVNPNDATVTKGAAALKKIQPTIDAACTVASTVTADSVENLIQTGLPALGTIIGTLPLPAATITSLQNAFTLAEITVGLVDVVVTNIQNAQKVAAVMAPAPTPLSGAALK
jgi:hypothetical protein